jgi:hypothetical protein
MWFHIIPDARCLLRDKRGVFHQKQVFRGPERRLFAQVGSGFIRLGAGDATSCPTMSLIDFDLPFTPERDSIKNPLMPASLTPPQGA